MGKYMLKRMVKKYFGHMKVQEKDSHVPCPPNEEERDS
jgi:hypothetical protein